MLAQPLMPEGLPQGVDLLLLTRVRCSIRCSKAPERDSWQASGSARWRAQAPILTRRR